MLRKKKTDEPPTPPADESPAPQAPPLVEALLTVHSANDTEWLADAVGGAAERGLGALYGLLFLADASGQLVGERPASSERMRTLGRLHQTLNLDTTTVRIDPGERTPVASAMREGRATAGLELSDVLPVGGEASRSGRSRLGVEDVWLAPLVWGGEALGLLVLLMPVEPPASLAEAELLGYHAAVALMNLREEERGRKRGELDAVRWIHDERRFLEQLRHELRRAQRHGRPLSIMLLRVRNLEELSTRYGRFLAERVLRHVGGRLDDAMRDTDFLGAYRQDGFATILVEADRDGAERARERLLAGVEKVTLPNTELRGLRIDIACGTATAFEDGETAEELGEVAEQRLNDAAAEPKAA